MQVAFHKMHGAGNDFIVLDERAQPLGLTPGTIARLADRHTGIGCDQLVLIAASDQGSDDIRVRFFNNDGSESGTCGNATRCVASLVAGQGAETHLRIRTDGGLLTARVLENGSVEIDMGRPGLDWRDIPLAHEADTLHLPIPNDPAGCSMGNPHATFFDHPADPAAAGPALETDPLFADRANIGFARILSRDRMSLRVWERGTGLTLACGSGACAAVVNAVRRGLTERRVAVEMDGGVLGIEWTEDGRVLMTGPAVISFTGLVELDDYR
ncbi:MAG: diaminopimelate epimerase [Janthinobacterium lividum]